MGKPLEEMMNDLQKQDAPTREQLEGDVKASHNWATAVRAGTYQGHVAVHIAQLLLFLDTEHEKAKQRYEAAVVKNPEWGTGSKQEAAVREKHGLPT